MTRDRRQIVVLAGGLASRLGELGLGLQVTDEARELIAAEGYDPVYGARPLRRVIQQRLENPLSAELIKGDFRDGDTVVVDVDGEEFTFRRGTPEVSDSAAVRAADDQQEHDHTDGRTVLVTRSQPLEHVV